MNKIKDIDYACPVAKIRAVENRLIDRVKLIRMAESQSMDEAVKIMKESGYEGADYEEMLARRMRDTYKFLRDISPSKDAFDIFLVKNDYHNIKVILKSEFLGKSYDYLLRDSGRYGLDFLKSMITNRVFTAFSPTLREAVSAAVDSLEKTGDPQTGDIILDRAAYSEMLLLAQRTENAYITDVVKTMIDLTNIKIAVRSAKMGKGIAFLQAALIPGGKIGTTGYRSDLPAVSELIKSSAYSVLSDSISDITELEKAIDNFMMDYIKRAKYIAFGIEPLVAYLLAVENEVKLARIILTGKKNGIPPDIIKERLRNSYV